MENNNFILIIIINSIISYVFMFITAKLMGKKQIAQLNFIDYVIGISIGSIGAEMATDYEQPFYIYLIAIAIFCVLEIIMSVIGRKGTLMKKIIIGKPLILIDKGKIDDENLKKSMLSVEELLSLCREKNYFNIDDIEFCILETSGKISILPKSEKTPPTVSDIGVILPKASLTPTPIIDGQVTEAALKSMCKGESWLKKRLDAQGCKLQDVLLATYDENTDSIHVHKKRGKKRKNKKIS
ncbi:MAG: DUF421 domain-containing protein [Eubacteriales bacterium]|nr:DUF421 domain-containing protein [Eubacteriales bacterium]